MTETRKRPSAGRGEYARSEGTKTRILDATLVEAGESGFQNTSVAKIAARAGVAVGVLNYHFGTKSDLLRELMATQVEDFLARLNASEDDRDADFFTQEARMLRTYLEFLHANPTYLRLAEEVRLHDPGLYQEGTRAHVDHICKRIQDGMARGEIRKTPAAVVRTQAFFIFGAYSFVDRLLAEDNYPGDAAVTASFISLIRGGMAPPEETNRD